MARESADPSWTDLDALAQAAECLKTLAHPHRLRMVQMLLRKTFSVGDLAQACGIPCSQASGHLRLLEHCGLLGRQRRGREVHYHVAEPCLQGILSCIEKRFASDGRA